MEKALKHSRRNPACFVSILRIRRRVKPGKAIWFVFFGPSLTSIGNGPNMCPVPD